jgi:hypothetical protein
MPTTPRPLIAALRIAASSVEQAAQLARPDPAELPPRLADKAKVALRRTAARYRKLASRL